MNLRLARLESNDEATRGVLYVDGRVRFATIERPWRDNHPVTSCIPTGHYICKRGNFPKNGETFEVMDVPGRSAILFHVANSSSDVEGCIGVGLGFLNRTDKLEIRDSRLGMKRFLDLLAGVSEVPLVIMDLTHCE